MKMSRTAIKELTAAYRAVLKHAFIAAMGAMVVIGGASAKAYITVNTNESHDIAAGSELAGYEQASDSGVAWVMGTLNVGSETVFKNNKGDIGGAISIAKGIGVLNVADNVTFEGNTSIYDGGAIGNYGGAVISKNAVFKNNHANIGLDGSVVTSDSQPIGGGAISMGINGQLDIVSGVFEGNTSGYDGGAIGTRRTLQPGEKTDEGFANLGNYIKISGETKFIGNHATGKTSDAKNGSKVGGNGGAIANTFATTDISGTTFTKNTAAAKGGAIYNHTFINDDAKGTDTGLGGVMTIRDSVFSENSAKGDGGAIYNTGTLTLDSDVFIGNSANGFGGAVGSKGQLTLKGTTFANNTASVGGAMYSGYNDAGVGRGSSEISGATFTNNSAEYGAGAVANYGSMKIDIDNTKFIGNKVTHEIEQDGWNNRNLNSSVDGGGALFVGSASTTSLNKTVFQNNSSTTAGGAIATRADWINSELGALQFKTNAPENYDPSKDYLVKNTKAKLDIKNSVFEQNKAGLQGGALFNTFMNTTIADSNFVDNVAGQGGAIYNAGAIELSGNNVFTGNMAGGVGNDIYNLGKLTVSDGTTTIDGGIAGDGALTIADGATLNIGTTTVQQKELTLDGTVGATIVGANNYGKLLAETYKGNGKVSLNVATTGTYNIFGENANEYTVVDAGAIYDVTKGDNGAITIATKNVEEIAKETGLTDIAANTVAALANADNDLANIASLNAQQALRNGDTDYVEIESAKANPIDQPVVQSVAQSVQSAVMTLAANRMAGTPSAGTMGRSGGDLSDADYGVWAQGMFNKSKFNGQFNGYTRGVSAGFDALIDKQYTIGLGYAFGHSDVHANGGRDTEIDSNTIFAYAQYKPSEWFVNAALNYTMSKYTETVDAFGVRLKADYDTDAFGGQVMTGYDFASGLTPEIGLRYLHVTQDSYNNGLNHVSSDDTDFLTGIAGMKYRFAIENDSVINWFPELRAAATYDFVSDKAMSTVTMPGAASYVVDGDRLSRFGGEFGIGLTAEYNGLEISLVYDLDLHQDYTSQTGMAKFRYEF